MPDRANRTDLPALRQALLDRRRQLLIRYKGELAREQELLGVREPDWEDLAAEQRDALLLDRLSDSDALKLNEVAEALRRIERGTYGKCESCSQPVSGDRLRALPDTRFCSDCASQREDKLPPPPSRE